MLRPLELAGPQDPEPGCWGEGQLQSQGTVSDKTDPLGHTRAVNCSLGCVPSDK